jgi:hypothetical protein
MCRYTYQKKAEVLKHSVLMIWHQAKRLEMLKEDRAQLLGTRTQQWPSARSVGTDDWTLCKETASAHGEPERWVRVPGGCSKYG